MSIARFPENCSLATGALQGAGFVFAKDLSLLNICNITTGSESIPWYIIGDKSRRFYSFSARLSAFIL